MTEKTTPKEKEIEIENKGKSFLLLYVKKSLAGLKTTSFSHLYSYPPAYTLMREEM